MVKEQRQLMVDDIHYDISSALYRVIGTLDYSDYVLMTTIGSWKYTLPDEDILTELKAWADWVIDYKKGVKQQPANYSPQISANEKKNINQAIKRELTIIFKKSGADDLAILTERWANGDADDYQFCFGLTNWLDAYN
jgi:hypothetical protein